ncbi:hypothetical protein O6H91_04G108200 [Diphasiastrum complanatum]|uniref:Uncharacterized protein n=1 Tax=Diphasiastrum complanatum TaxID=34168 RepID=A0ACC2E111_DIPCM|nr:hypothetical protein O6H91_04G108200 [Diphasiastrum complanatum]
MARLGRDAGMQPSQVMKKLRRAFVLPFTSLFASPNASSQMQSKSMGWMRSRVVTPLQRAWGVFALRIRFRKRGRGFGNLYDDVQACGYEDVQVMWSMLHHHS